MRIAFPSPERQDGPLESGYFDRPVPSPLPDLERQTGATWEWFLRPEVHCLEQWLDFNA